MSDNLHPSISKNIPERNHLLTIDHLTENRIKHKDFDN